MKSSNVWITLVASGALALGVVQANEEKSSSSTHSSTSATIGGKGEVKAAATDVKKECNADIQKLCKGITPGEGRLNACLESKQDQLSTGCNESRMKLSQIVSEKMDKADVAFRKNCGSDVQKYCAEVPSGAGRLLDCLSEHKDMLSSSCQSFQTKLEARINQSLG